MPKKIMRLYDLKKGDKIYSVTNRSPEKKEVITFDHVDGMYSYNTLPDGEVVHIANMAPIKRVGKHYELIMEKIYESKPVIDK